MDEEMKSKIKEIEEIISKYNSNADLAMLEKAFDFAEKAHKGQLRKSGEPFFIHPLAVAKMLAEMEMDMPSIIAGILHDVVEDTEVTSKQIAEEFSSEIAYLVDGVTKLKHIPVSSKEELQAENLRKMFISMASDIRVIVIKLVDRLHNMRTLQYVNTDSQITKARETLEIYTPLAHRLGMSKIKWELEDLCFKYLEPDTYQDLKKQINAKREDREKYIQGVLETIREKTSEAGLKVFLDGRPKHLYSVYKKMVKQNKTLEQIYDLIAIRVIVDTVQECYTILGIIHELYKPMPGRFKDYISMPKPNMYQSLHTTLIGPDGMPFEAQIRTWEMHKIAESGIAAHWKYKEGGTTTSEFDEKLDWVRHLLDIQKDSGDASQFVDTFKMDLFTEEVFVFTPKGDVKNLPAGSNPIDFAYSIHSAIGNRMIGAKVNGEIKPLNYRLKNGDIVDVITTKETHGPSRDWLSIVKSSEAKSKIRQWFKKERREENIEHGKSFIERELKKQGFTHEQLFNKEYIGPILKKHNFNSIDDLLNVVGFGELTAQKVVSRLRDEYLKDNPKDVLSTESLENIVSKEKKQTTDSGIVVKGIDNCLVRFSKCCNPVPGDNIVGYITRGRGVSIHRADCPNIQSMNEFKDREIDVRWAQNFSTTYNAELTIKALDRSNLMLEIAGVIAEQKLNMRAISARTTKDNYGIIDLTVEISERTQLDKLIKKLNQIDSIVEVMRKSS